MKARMLFFYGVSVGVAGSCLAVAFFDSPAIRWLFLAAAVALAIGLILHKRLRRVEVGRRWRRTV